MLKYQMSIKSNNMKRKGQFDILIGLFWAFIIITTLVALVPGFTDIISMGQDSEHLNCPGYVDADNPSLSYNSTLSSRTSPIGCLGFKLYIPYIVLGVLIVIASKIIYGSRQQQGGVIYQ